jgi:hypothetical protein
MASCVKALSGRKQLLTLTIGVPVMLRRLTKMERSASLVSQRSLSVHVSPPCKQFGLRIGNLV